MSKDMNQIIKTEIESTEKESMFHKKTSRMLDAINPLCGSHSAPASGSSVHMLMDYRHGIGNLLRPAKISKRAKPKMKSIFKIRKLKVTKLSLSISKISQFNVSPIKRHITGVPHFKKIHQVDLK